MPALLVEEAPAKVNLTLRVLGRRADGYHEIESLVAFASVGDALSFAPGGALALNVRGPSAAQAGARADNLVLKAARALADRLPTVGAGTFDLEKRLPVAYLSFSLGCGPQATGAPDTEPDQQESSTAPI